MRYAWIGRFFFWLVLLGVVAIVVAIAAQLGLQALGASQADAVIMSTAAAVAIALAAADVFTPIGSNLASGDGEEEPRALLPDFAAAGVAGAATAGLARALGAAGLSFFGGQTVATLLGVTVGYLTFVASSRRHARREGSE
jgi:hypothetical protein